jgi:hypothetical protein
MTKDINIETLMTQIREQIVSKGTTVAKTDQGQHGIGGTRFPPDFYEHLRQAQLAHNQIQVPAFLSENNTPIIGGLLQSIRLKIHELVLFYVNQVASNQVRVNAHLLQALIIMSQELEDEG